MKTAVVLGVLAITATVLYTALRTGEHLVDWTGRPEVTITLTAHGFEPAAVYITRGTTVTFKTERNEEFWPASDVHPHHTVYPEFDPRRALDPHETWSFVFDKDGHWGYHDHIDTVTMGYVVVVPPGVRGAAEYDVFPTCDQMGLDARRSCWKERIRFALEKNGIDAAFDELNTLHLLDKDFPDTCHQYVHDLGLLAYKKYGEHVPFTEKAVGCGQGFWHGYMEAYLKHHDGDVALAKTYCEKLNDPKYPQRIHTVLQCYHGIGHGLMEYTINVRPDLATDIPQLIKVGVAGCEIFDTEDDKIRCSSGVFAVTRDWLNLLEVEADYVSLTSLYELCQYDDRSWSRRGCMLEFSNEAIRLSDRDAAKTFKSIVRESSTYDAAYTSTLVTYTALFLGTTHVSADDAVLAEMCSSLIGTAYRIPCLRGIIAGLLINGQPGGRDYERAMRFCLSPSASDARDICGRMVVTHMEDTYGPEGKEQACAALKANEMPAAYCDNS